MDVYWIDPAGVRTVAVRELADLWDAGEGFAWVDIPPDDPDAEHVLRDVFGFHPRAVLDCLERNHVPKCHVYADHLFVVLHAPEHGAAGHVHYLELDQFIGDRYLVTVHGPLSPAVPATAALQETDAVAARLTSGRLRPARPADLSYVVVSAVVRREEAFVGDLARTVGRLEQQVMSGVDEDPLPFLERLYQSRHELLAVRTMTAQSAEVYGRAYRLSGFLGEAARQRLDDVTDQFVRLRRLTDGQLAFLHGVTEFYRARTDTKMTIAAERLAVIAALTLPVTAISSVLGMNVIVNSSTHWPVLLVVVTAMSALSLVLLRWARRQGWW